MKKFELTAFIKEEILSTLNEDAKTQQDIKDTEELTKAMADLAKAKEEAGLTEENIGLADIEEMGYEAGGKAFEKIKSRFMNKPDHQAYRKGFFQGYIDQANAYDLNENEDKEPSKADLKKTKGLAKAKEELAQLTKQMKSLARDYKKAEGAEKEKIVADLKKKTKLKRELEAIIDK